MTVLWVIGNGFDLHHGLKSTYLDFSTWLHEEAGLLPGSCERVLKSGCAGVFCQEWIAVPKITAILENDRGCDVAAAVPFICRIISSAHTKTSAWSDLETNLAGLEFSSIFDEVEPVTLHGEVKEWRTAYLKEDIQVEVEEALGLLPKFFREWVRSALDVSELECCPGFRAAVAACPQQFLTFNYTTTLQDVYGISDAEVCHVHGQANRAGSELRFGHSQEPRTVVDGYEGDWSKEAEYAVDQALKKQLNVKALDGYKDAGISVIVFFGFGFGSEDLDYVKKLAEVCGPEIPVAILGSEGRIEGYFSETEPHLEPLWGKPVKLVLEDSELAAKLRVLSRGRGKTMALPFDWTTENPET
ncbi:AbiH family protein [Corynebacterium sp. H127]|uniref:AbiH family protein n=1 Tax=Corynebacterium sp. H127 TaxID=3133418 RepID=UPI0030B61C7E